MSSPPGYPAFCPSSDQAVTAADPSRSGGEGGDHRLHRDGDRTRARLDRIALIGAAENSRIRHLAVARLPRRASWGGSQVLSELCVKRSPSRWDSLDLGFDFHSAQAATNPNPLDWTVYSTHIGPDGQDVPLRSELGRRTRGQEFVGVRTCKPTTRSNCKRSYDSVPGRAVWMTSC